MVVKINPDPTLRNNLMAFGFECDKGWYPLIEELIKELDKLPEEIEVLQVKEKFGSLRFYVLSASDIAYDIIDKYQELSQTTCEICEDNTTGRVREKNRWYKSLCDNCAKENGYKEIEK